MRVRCVLTIESAFFHAANAPVEVAREAVGKVVGRSQPAACDEGLVAYQHSHAETFPGEFFGRFQPSHRDKTPFAVDDGRLAVNDVGTVFSDEIGYLLQRIGCIEAVARVEKDEVFAVGRGNAFVHGVVEAAVGFAHEVRHAGVLPGKLYRCIAGSPVDDEVFIAFVGLGGHRFEGGP